MTTTQDRRLRFRLAAELAALRLNATPASGSRQRHHLNPSTSRDLLRTSQLRGEKRRLDTLLCGNPPLPADALPYLQHARARCVAQLARLECAWDDWSDRMSARIRAKDGRP